MERSVSRGESITLGGAVETQFGEHLCQKKRKIHRIMNRFLRKRMSLGALQFLDCLWQFAGHQQALRSVKRLLGALLFSAAFSEQLICFRGQFSKVWQVTKVTSGFRQE